MRAGPVDTLFSCPLLARLVGSARHHRPVCLKEETGSLTASEGESATDPAPATERWPRRLRTAMGVTALGFAGYLLFQLLAPQTIGEQARRLFERQLSQHYRDWDVSVSRGTYRAGVGLVFESIRLRPRSPRTGLLTNSLVGSLGDWWGADDAVRIQRLTVFADLEPSKLFGDESPLRTHRIAVEGVTADMRVDADGTHNLATLWPLPQFGPICPRIDVIDATVTVTCPLDCASTTTNVPAKSLSSVGGRSQVASGPAGPLSAWPMLAVARTRGATSAGGSDPSGSVEASISNPPIQVHWSKISIRSTFQRIKRQQNLSGQSVSRIADREFQSRRVEAVGSSSLSGPIELLFQEQANRTAVVSQSGSSGTAQMRNAPSASAHRPNASRLELRCQDLQVDESVLHRLAPLLGSQVCQLDAIAGVRWNVLSDIALVWYRRPESGDDTGRGSRPTGYQVDWKIQDGGWSDPRLPSPLTKLRGRIQLSPESIKVFPTQAHFSDAVCRLSGAIDLNRRPDALVGTPGATDLRFSAEGLTIGPELANVLPRRAAALWRRFQPEGRLDVDTRWRNRSPLDGQFWDLEGDVLCRGIDVRFDRFPYPVNQLIGAIRIADGQAEAVNLTGRAGGQILHCGFRAPVRIGPFPAGDTASSGPGTSRRVTGRRTFVAQTEGAVPIDDELIRALTPRYETLPGGQQRPAQTTSGLENSGLEKFVRSLSPSGAVELAAATIDIAADGTVSRSFDLRVTGGALRYDRFPYPLYNVAGRIKVQDDLVRLIGFTGNNAGVAKIACDGLYQIADDPTRSELNLGFRVADVAMEHSLRGSLPESSRAIWDSLAPAGTLDRLSVHVHRRGLEPVALVLRANQIETEVIGPDTLSLRPTALPYRVDIVGGSLRYQQDEVTIEGLRGRHDGSRLIADGRCRRQSDGRWLLTMDLHSGCRVTPDEELIRSLPRQMGQAMRQLDLRGPVRIRGQTNLLLSESEQVAPEINWDLRLQLEGNRIGDVGPVHSMRGEVNVSGVSNAEVVRAGGTVAIDSMHVAGLQITSIRGPFSILDDELRLGTSSSPLDPISAKPPLDASLTRQGPIVGQVFGGILDLNGAVSLTSGDFDVGIAISAGELNTLLAEMGQSRSDLTGRFDFQTRVDGRLGDMDLLKGSGRGQLSGANLYKLPLVVQVLNLLRITPTEDVAFTDGEMEFTLFGEDINFNRLMLWGDLVALDGGGTVTRREKLDLSFNTRVSPQNLMSKVLSPLRDDRYTFWTIEVDGPIDRPTIRRHALSGFAQTMEAWFPGMVRSTTAETQAVQR